MIETIITQYYIYQKHKNNHFHQQSGQQATNKIRINRVLLISTFKKVTIDLKIRCTKNQWSQLLYL